ncbi:hypothetical protein ALC62_13843 [Cyphomyrmex costatus]|uniref:Uncharacterized protein n=1 Tax=Cyphomyrmex costatus TaxID=456900 RepID=A0A195C468_9HYME|nr:hypothetical protein ALC62_13843 [Cyphomyrmex costatus]
MLAHHAAPPVNSCPPGVGRGGGPARRGDTTLLTRVRCAHLGVTHSFVPSDPERAKERERENASRPCPPRSSVDRLVVSPPSITLPYSVIARPSRTTALDFRRRSLDFHLIPPFPRSISFCTTSLLCLPSFYDTLAYFTLFLINCMILLTFYYHLNYMHLTFITT